MMIKRLVEKPFTNKFSLRIRYGRISQLKPKTWCQVSVFHFHLSYIFFISELLCKERVDRISISDALDHPWFSGTNSDISKMRKEALKDGNDMMKFISYSNIDAKIA